MNRPKNLLHHSVLLAAAFLAVRHVREFAPEAVAGGGRAAGKMLTVDGE
jgi:hypothetical protein